MKRFLIAALLLLASVGAAFAGTESDIFCFVSGAVPPNNWQPCTASNPLQISGSISASLGGFTPSASGARGTPFSVTTSDSNGTLPTGTVVIVSNPGANPMYCNVNGVAATTSDQPIAAGVGNWFAFTIPSGVTTLHCIATGGSTIANMLGGSGLATGSGGGGAGGGGAITIASGAVASGAYASGAFASGAFASGAVASGAFASGSIASGAMVDFGSQADSVCGTDTGTCSLIALMKRNNVDTAATGNIQGLGTAGSASGGVLTVQGAPSMTPVLTQTQAVASGGWTPKWFIAANSDNATNLKNSAGIVHAVEVYGINAAPAYLKFYDKASSPTCGTDTIVKQIMIPAASTAANGAGSNAIVLDTQFSTGISYCVVTGIGATDDTSVTAANFVINIDWK